VLETIREFLAQKRIAVAGVSRDPKDFNRSLFRSLREKGYDLVPVNPNAQEIDGVRCFASVRDIQPPVDGVLALTRPEATEAVVRDCIQAGVKRVWMYKAAGQGAVSQAAVDLCAANSIQVVPGYCPFMFLEGAEWFHRLHGGILKLFGRYPK
jgi:predicted CoA-binding protein